MSEETRKGKGPCFVEISTFRWREHCGPNYDNDLGYRSQKEVNYWKNKDPLIKLKKQILNSKPSQVNILKKIEEKVYQEINLSFSKAQKSKFPSENDAYKDVYAK